MKIEKGLIFTGRWFKGRVEVLGVDELNNQLKVYLNNQGSDYAWEETWDLQVVKWGFENGDYFL